MVGDFHDLFGEIGAIKDDLGEAETVAHVNEGEAGAVAAIGVDPAVEADGLSDVGFAKFAAGV